MYVILLIYLFFDEIASFIFTVFNIEIPTGSNNLTLYVYLKMGLAVISFVYILFKIFSKRKITKFFIYTLFITLLIFINILITSYRYSGELLSKNVLIYIIYLVPFQIFCGICVPNFNIEVFIKQFKFVLLSIFLTGLIGILIPISQGNMIKNVNGFTYQSTSYFFAMGLTICLLKIVNGESFTMVRRLLYFLLSVYFIILSLNSGGKGSVVVICILIMLFMLLNANSFKRICTILLSIILSINLIVFMENKIPVLSSGIDRALSFISLDKTVILENSSGRDKIYEVVIQMISEKPLLGWGFGSVLFSTLETYPHNFFLEVLVDGGIFYLFMWLVIIIINLIFLIRKSIKDKKYCYLLFPYVFYLIYMQFSGSYLNGMYFFWFINFYCIYNLTKKNQVYKYIS